MRRGCSGSANSQAPADTTPQRQSEFNHFDLSRLRESARNPGVFLHPNGLAFSVSENTRRTARGDTTDLQLTFAGTTAGLNPATSSAERALGNLGAFFQQWRHNIPAHLGKETAVHEAAEDLLGATQEQIRLQGMALRPRYGKVTLVGHSLGANAALHASAVRASRDGITPVIAIDSPGVRYSPQTLAHLTTLGRKTGRTAEQLLTDAHVHIYGEGDPVVDSAHLPLSGADVHKPIATTFELPDTENRSALITFTSTIFDDTVFDHRLIRSFLWPSAEPCNRDAFARQNLRKSRRAARSSTTPEHATPSSPPSAAAQSPATAPSAAPASTSAGAPIIRSSALLVHREQR